MSDPKLRGIAISSIIPKIYDIILNNRFNMWYCPNLQQAGFRPQQGCLIQIFTIFLMIELANYNNLLTTTTNHQQSTNTNRADVSSRVGHHYSPYLPPFGRSLQRTIGTIESLSRTMGKTLKMGVVTVKGRGKGVVTVKGEARVWS